MRGQRHALIAKCLRPDRECRGRFHPNLRIEPERTGCVFDIDIQCCTATSSTVERIEALYEQRFAEPTSAPPRAHAEQRDPADCLACVLAFSADGEPSDGPAVSHNDPESWIEADVRFVSVLTPPLGLVDFGVAPVIGERLAECSKELGIIGARRKALRVEAFADHWGNTEVDETQWWGENRDEPNAGFDPALWVVVRDGGTIAGFSICRERQDAGETIGWISLLGVRPRWRGRGLGEALLVQSLNAFHSRGRRRAALNVDVENTTGALRLYTKVGMEPTPAFTVWTKTLDNQRVSLAPHLPSRLL